MEYRAFPAPPHLATWIECIWMLRGSSPAAQSRHRVLPDGCIEVILHLGEPMLQDGRRQPRRLVAAQMDQHLMLEADAAVEVLGVRFRPEGARAFLRVPMDLLTNQVVELDAVLGSAESRAFGEAGGVDRLWLLLEERLRDAPRPDAAVAEAVALTAATAGAVTVDQLAARLGLSARHLGRAFRDQVGIPPKLFAQILRFQQVFTAWEESNWGRLADLAAECGFYDQAHLCHEFQRFSGLNPTEFFARQEVMAHFFTRARRMSDFYKRPR